ncbi:MAG: hypothetical protein ACHQFX_11485 [Chitinophagales bacterium]
MRSVVLCGIFLAKVFICCAQLPADELKKLRKKRITNYAVTGSMVFIAGAADGVNQALVYKYGGVKRVFPNLNDQYWWPVQSAYNKYKNGDPALGAKFPGSCTWLVFTTDGYHMTRFINHLFMSGAIAFKIVGHEKKKWYVYLMEVAGYWIINRAGFCLTYNRFTYFP